VSEDAAPERIAVIWSPEARANLRAIEREIAMQILHCIDRYLASRTGDVKKLKPPRTDFRLRCGGSSSISGKRTPSRFRACGIGERLTGSTSRRGKKTAALRKSGRRVAGSSVS
jgi:hypothetical protein